MTGVQTCALPICRVENKADSGHYCNGVDVSSDTNKGCTLSRVSSSDINCIPSNTSSNCDSSSSLDGKQSSSSCHDSQKSSKPTLFTPSKQVNGYACCSSDQPVTSYQRYCCQQADKLEQPCCSEEPAKTKIDCCKSKSVEENQEELSFVLPSMGEGRKKYCSTSPREQFTSISDPCKVKAVEDIWCETSKNVTQDFKLENAICCNSTTDNKNVINSCCQKDDNINFEKTVSCSQNSHCDTLIEVENESHQFLSCTPHCDDINGHHISCTNVHKSSFTISMNTVLLESPDDLANDYSNHEGSVLLPQKCTTKLRVQNICCIMEANLVRECLEPMESVYSVAVNVVGRIAHVQHNPQITSPTELVNCLNKIHLGASIMEIGRAHV